MKFQGLYTAIVTPFAGNRVDEEAFRMLVEAQIAAGVAGIVAVGTTGESPTLTVKEHLRVNRIGRGERGWPYSGYCGNGC